MNCCTVYWIYVALSFIVTILLFYVIFLYRQTKELLEERIKILEDETKNTPS